MVEIRQAEEKDKDRILDLNRLSYSLSPGELQEMKDNFSFIREDHYVAVDDKEEIVAVLRSIPLLQNIRGEKKKMSGIAMVATSPETRRQGNIRKLIEETFYLNYEADIAVSTLYPFKDSYYKQFGYINAASHQFIEINPQWLSPWHALPKGYSLKRTTVADAGDILKRLHTHSMNQFHGGVERPERRWKEFIDGKKDVAIIAYNPKGEPEGYLSYALSGYGFKLFGENNIGTFNRVRFYHNTLQGKHSLLHYLYLHSDQIHRVVLPLYPHESNYYSWMNGYAKVNIRQHLQTMVRIIDIEKAFENIPISRKGEFNFSVSDDSTPWNNGTYQFTYENGRIHVERFADSKDPHITKISLGALASLLYGISSLSELEYFGWIHGLTNTDRELLKSWFPQMAYCLSEFF